MKRFSVDIQQTVERTYQVEARSAEAAEKKAMRLYLSNATETHVEHLDPEITNCEEITNG